MINRNSPCPCGSGKKYKVCCIRKQRDEDLKSSYQKQYQIDLKEAKEIAGIKRACEITAEILRKTALEAKEGVTTLELDNYAKELMKKAGVKSAAYHYGAPPFPGYICTSKNEVICHGIPDQVKLQGGDIMNLDIACIVDNYFGDCSQMVIIGETTPEKKRLVEVTKECLDKSIAILKPGVLLSEIGDVISDHAEQAGYSVVYEFVGHGVGKRFHEAPQVHHNRNDMQIPLAEGMTFTIEPMINMGVAEGEIDPRDQWTCYTRDRQPSAQFEHTLLITKDGCEVLTKAWDSLYSKRFDTASDASESS